MTTVQLDPQTIKRLAFIRLLYRHGVEQSHRPEPLAFTSVLSLHDAVELFLVLTGEHLRATLDPRIEFLKYWKAFSTKAIPNGVNLSGYVGMDRLNRLRTALKHTGAMPGLTAIEQARADVRNFFEDNTPMVFGVDFNDVDMADLVPQNTIRDKIKSAVAANSSGDRDEGMALLVETFDDLFDAYTDPHSYPPSPFDFGGRVSYPLRERDVQAILRRPDNDRHARYVPARGEESLARQICQVTGIAGELQTALRVVVLGIDFHQYLRFRRLTPSVDLMMDGGRTRNYPKDYASSQDEFGFCHEFVISAAMRLAELEAHLRPPSWTQGTR